MEKIPNAVPDAHFMRLGLEQLRAVRIAPAQDRPPGVTDVKLFRVLPLSHAKHLRTGRCSRSYVLGLGYVLLHVCI